MRFPEFKGEWQKTVLRKICNIQRGGSPRPILNFISNSKDAVNWIKISDVDIDGHIWRTQEKIKPEGVKYSRKVYKGDLLLSNSMSFGVPYILEVDGCIHDGWLVIKPFSKEVNLKFLYQYLSCPWCLNQYKRLASGGVVNNLNKNLVSSIRLSLPENLEQDKISEFLALLDERISVQRKTIEDYQEKRHFLLRYIYSLISKNKVKRLREIVNIKTGKLNASASKAYGKYKFFTCSRNDSLTDTFSFDEKAIIIPGNGDLGIVKYYEGKFDAYQRTYICTSKEKSFDLKYIKLILEECLPHIVCQMKNTSAMTYIVISTLENICVPQIEIEKQKYFAQILDNIDNSIAIQENILSKLLSLKKYLINNLFI